MKLKKKNCYSTRKGFEECVRKETAHLATLKSADIETGMALGPGK